MEVKRRKKRTKATTPKDRFLEQSSTFAAFGHLFQINSEQAKAKAEKDAVMTKVCSGLSEVCKMLAEAEGRHMGKQKKWPPEREPDVETKGFRLWRGEKGEDYSEALLTVNYDEGEEFYESRSYNAFILGYSLLVLSKSKKDQYWWAVKGKRPDGTTFIKTDVQGPLSLEEYHKELARLELVFSLLFDTTNPLVTPGKHYNLYVRGYAGKGGNHGNKKR